MGQKLREKRDAELGQQVDEQDAEQCHAAKDVEDLEALVRAQRRVVVAARHATLTSEAKELRQLLVAKSMDMHE
jgi:hypothetical protein